MFIYPSVFHSASSPSHIFVSRLRNELEEKEEEHIFTFFPYLSPSLSSLIHVFVPRLRNELEREREERNYVQSELERVQRLWEVAAENLDNLRKELR